MKTPRRGDVLLALASVTLTLVGIETLFRVAAYVRHRHSFERAINNPPPLGPDRRAAFGHLLRPSRNPRLIYELRPNLSVLLGIRGESDSRVRTNSQGFRGPEYAVQKAAGTYRILGLGDSLMFGWGVNQGKDYLSILERRLERRHPERRWEVINTAVPGYNTVMEVETLKARGLAYQPDLVILGYCGNDFDLPNFIWPDEPYLSFRASFLYRFVEQRAGRKRSEAPLDVFGSGMEMAPEGKAGGLEGDPKRVPPRYRQMVGWDAFAHSTREMLDLGQEHGFRVAFLVFVAGGDGRRPRVIDHVRSLGLSVIDVGAAQESFMREKGIQKYDGSVLTLSAQDPHPSVLSHRMAADVILDWMSTQGLLPVSSPAPGDQASDTHLEPQAR